MKMVVPLVFFAVLSGSGRHFPRVLCMPFVLPILSWELPTRLASKAMLVVLLRTCPEGMFGPWVETQLGSRELQSFISGSPFLYNLPFCDCRRAKFDVMSQYCRPQSYMICMHASCMAHPFSNERLENADWWFLKLGAVPAGRSTRVLDHLLVPVWHCPVSATVKALLSRLKQCAEQSGQSGGFKHFLFSIIYGIILPIDSHIFQDGYCATNQLWIVAFFRPVTWSTIEVMFECIFCIECSFRRSGELSQGLHRCWMTPGFRWAFPWEFWWFDDFHMFKIINNHGLLEWKFIRPSHGFLNDWSGKLSMVFDNQDAPAAARISAPLCPMNPILTGVSGQHGRCRGIATCGGGRGRKGNGVRQEVRICYEFVNFFEWF